MTKKVTQRVETFRPAPARLGAAATSPAPSILPLVIAVALLAAATFIGYRGAVKGEFLGADHELFQRSPFVIPPAAAGASPAALPAWIPRTVTTCALALDRIVWGPLPAGFRLTNVALHLIAT